MSKNVIIGMSRTFARAKIECPGMKKWSCQQNKMFELVLSKIDWKKGNNPNVIELYPSDIKEALGWNIDDSNINAMMYQMKQELVQMGKTSWITVSNPYTRVSISDALIIHVETDGGVIKVGLNPHFMPHFERLYNMAEDCGITFILFLANELYGFNSKYSLPLLMELRSCGKTGNAINQHELTTAQLKTLFGMSEEDYTSFEKKSGKIRFDRSKFERRVLDRAVAEINSTNMINLIPDEEGNYYKKVKENSHVKKYVFRYQLPYVNFDNEKDKATA